MATKRNAVAQYFANIYSAVVTTFLGMKLTARYMVSKPVTELYPEVKPQIPAGSRGLHKFIAEQCMACQQCVKICPVSCIKLEYLGRGKDSLITVYDIDYQRCLFCNLCAEVCPTEAIVLTDKWDGCSYTREGCRVHFVTPRTEQEIRAFEEEMAAKEAEKKRKAAEAAAAKAAAEAKAAEDNAAEPVKP